jgi:WD40 repeat protein
VTMRVTRKSALCVNVLAWMMTFLTPEDVAIISRVCTAWSTAGESLEVLWQEKYQLEFGKQTLPPCNESKAVCSHGVTTAWRERLTRRRLIEANWRELHSIGDEAKAFTRFGADTLHVDTSRYGSRRTNTVLCMLVWWDRGLVISGAFDQIIRVWDIGSGVSQLDLVGHEGAIMTLAGSEDQDLLVSGAGDRAVRLWQVSTGVCLGVLACDLPMCLLWFAVLPAKVVVVGGRSGVVKIFDGERVGDGEQGLELTGGGTSHVTALVSDGKRIVCGDEDGDIRIFELEGATCTGVLFQVPAPADLRCLLLRGDTLVAGWANGEIRVWDDLGSADHTPREFKEENDHVSSMVLSMSWQDRVGPMRVVSNHRDAFRLWDFETGRCIMFLATMVFPANGVDGDDLCVHGCAADFHRLVYAQGADIKVIDVQMPNPDGYDDSKQGR